MSAYEISKLGSCCLDSLIDGHYSYCQDEDGIADTLNQIFKKGYYEREYDYAV
ncbi:MAG: hypothetical protein J6K73_07975 [Clostridia bacterium]|nr:hypothetical protein [Clostridia bacterium]